MSVMIRKTHTVKENAELVAEKVEKGAISVHVEKQNNMGYASGVNMYLNLDKLRELGWSAEVDMVESYSRLLDYLRYEMN